MLTSLNDLSALKSSDFGDNPLLSNSKMWKHSPIKNETPESNDSVNNGVDESSFCSFKSPIDEEEDENMQSLSPLPKI